MSDDHVRYREWLDQAVDGSLSEPDRAELDRHLAGCADCRVDERRLVALRAALESARLPVRAGFAAEIVRSLPAAPWEARAPRAWRYPALILLLLGGTAAILLGSAAAHVEPQARFFSAATAIVDLLRASLVAGFGLLGASWKSLGLGIAEWLSTSKLNWLAAAVLVAGVNYFLYRLVSGRRRTSPAPAPRSRD